MNPILTINVIYLGRFLRKGDTQDILNRYPGENATDIQNQANYFAAIHGYVH